MCVKECLIGLYYLIIVKFVFVSEKCIVNLEGMVGNSWLIMLYRGYDREVLIRVFIEVLLWDGVISGVNIFIVIVLVRLIGIL